MSRIICMCLLLIGAISDIKTKTIPIWLLIAGNIIGLINVIFSENRSDLIFGGVFGLVMFCLSVVIKDLGTGDGLMIMVIGLMRGLSICIESLLIAFFLVTISGGLILLVKRNGKKLFLPFIPYVLIGVIAVDVVGVAISA